MKSTHINDITKLQLLWAPAIFLVVLFYFTSLYSFLSHFIFLLHSLHPCTGCIFVFVVLGFFMHSHSYISILHSYRFFCLFCVYFLQLSFTTMAIINCQHFTSIRGRLPTAAKKLGGKETNGDKTNLANFWPCDHRQKRATGFKSYDRVQLIQKLNKLSTNGGNSQGAYNDDTWHLHGRKQIKSLLL